MKQLQAKVAQLESSDRSSGTHLSESTVPLRDSFGSFVDTSNPRVTRRLSTIGVPSLQSSRAPSLSSHRPSIVHPSKPAGSDRVDPVKRTYTAHRRISLIERSRLATTSSSSLPAAPQSASVTGVVRLGTVRRASQAPRRQSVVPPPASARVKSEEPKETTPEAESESKKPKYTVSVSRTQPEVKAAYTYTPSTDRKALDTLIRNQRMSIERDPEMSITGEEDS